MPDAHANLAVVTLANNPGLTGMTFTVGSGEGAALPPVPFNAFVFPNGQFPTKANTEIVRVVNVSGDTLTIGTRKAEPGSGARNAVAGDVLIAGATVKTFTDIEVAITTEVARALESETLLASQVSEQAQTIEAMGARLTSVEARLGGLAGSGKPLVVTSALVGASHTPETLTLKGEIDPEGATTRWWFEYGETEALGSSSAVQTGLTGSTLGAVSQTITSGAPGLLTAGVFFRLVAENSNGVTRGAIMQPSPTITMRPTASYATTPITNVTTAAFTGNAIVNPNGEATTITLEWGTTTGYGSTKALGSTPSGRTPENISITASGLALTGGTTYHYRIKAKNTTGETNLADGTFTVGAAGETLIGDQTAYTAEAHTSKGRVEAIPYTVKKTGTLEKITFKTKEAATDEPTLTEIRVAVYKDDGTGKPVIEAALAEGGSTAAAIKEAEKEVVVNLGSSIAVVAGEKLWLGVLPVGGGKVHFHASVLTGGEKTYESAFGEAAHTAMNNVKGWESNGAQAPMMIWGVGTTTTTTNVPALTLASNKEEIEWASLGGETAYELRISEQPITTTGRTTAIISQAKGANPQKFKPKANTTYGTTPSVTLTPGQTAYIEARVEGTSTWSNAVGVSLAGEAAVMLKGINAGGWDAPTEVGDYEEAKLNVVRLNKPTAARVAELEGKGIKVVYLYYGDVSGYNAGGVKAINRVAWVADAMKKIKECKLKYFECLNEPQQGFWGSEANTQENAAAYVELLKLLYTEVQTLPSGERPKIIASMDGGSSTSKSWVEKMKTANAAFTGYFDLGSVHPYFKSGGNATGKLGNRANVESIYAYIGSSKHIAITEVGWPTIVETGDSYKYSEAEQAEAVAGFLAWAKGKGYIDLVTLYNYRDGSDKKGYGLWNENDSPKTAVAKLAAA